MLTNWTVITKAMLNSYLEASLVATLDTKDLAAGQTDRFTQCATDIANEFKARLQAPPRMMQVSATALAVPPELVGHACRLILVAMQASCPAIVLEKDQVTLLRKSWDVFDLIEKGQYVITTPSDPSTAQVQGQPAAAAIVCVDESKRQCTMRKFNGL